MLLCSDRCRVMGDSSQSTDRRSQDSSAHWERHNRWFGRSESSSEMQDGWPGSAFLVCVADYDSRIFFEICTLNQWANISKFDSHGGRTDQQRRRSETVVEGASNNTFPYEREAPMAPIYEICSAHSQAYCKMI